MDDNLNLILLTLSGYFLECLLEPHTYPDLNYGTNGKVHKITIRLRARTLSLYYFHKIHTLIRILYRHPVQITKWCLIGYPLLIGADLDRYNYHDLSYP